MRIGRLIMGISVLSSAPITAGILSAVTGVNSFPLVSITMTSLIAFFGGILFCSGFRGKRS